jgi:DNA-binding response OmpR family regulator
MANRVLIIDDEQVMRALLASVFIEKGFEVVQAQNGKEGFQIFCDHPFDLVILDVMMPVMDGWSVCRRIREFSNVLIIMLTSRDEDDDQLLGYELGVDEYVTKPVNLKVLLAKSTRLLERMNNDAIKHENLILAKNNLIIDKTAYTVKVHDSMVDFAPKEYELLVYLAENDGRVLTREQILNMIWGYDYYGDDRVVDTHIKKIRKKLGTESEMIQTVIRTGYKFNSIKD